MKNNQKILIFITLTTMVFIFINIYKYWFSDYLYASGKNYNSFGQPETGASLLIRAVNLSPNQSLFRNELAISYALMSTKDKKYAVKADQEAQKALKLSPTINIIRSQFGIYIKLSSVDPNYILTAKKIIDQAIILAPNDPKLIYNLGLLYAKAGQNEEAIKLLKKAIELRPNYQDPQNALKILQKEKSP